MFEFDNNTIEKIEYTPTLIHYENGEEETRLVGQQSEDDIRDFFKQNIPEAG
ncbi:hypothetical protein GCM10028778_22250 [Barrientosiimonas marina]|uniref:Thioredoxin n=1 Tax=Lentibacillus kimchii TaxID=1542911 RepID=A0ABW2UWN4_9BACI